MIEEITHGSFGRHWDLENVTYWEFLIHNGSRPFRDFWYPYGGFYIFDLPLPVGILAKWGFLTVVYALFGLLLFRITRRSAFAKRPQSSQQSP